MMQETFCGPCCQHPTCWDSQRRANRLSRVPPLPLQPIDATLDDSSDDEGGLPTQKVVNLFGNFEDDDEDDLLSLPSRTRSAPERSAPTRSVSLVKKSPTKDTLAKSRAPHATPASDVRPAVRDPKVVQKVEVQEVFEFDELNDDWQDTFMASQYYVWVPNTARKSQDKPAKEQKKKSNIRRITDTVGSLIPKDVTSTMVPPEFDLHREQSTIKKPLRCISPQFGHPRNYKKSSDGNYYGIYELLDLPKEILTQVLQHIKESDMQSRGKLGESLVKALPKLEKSSSALSIAQSQILQQRKMDIKDGHERVAASQRLFPSYQYAYRLDPGGRSPVLPLPADLSQPTIYNINKKKPLPPVKTSEDGAVKVPSISLGLPEIRPGVKGAKPFTYKRDENELMDFSLGPVPTPRKKNEPMRLTASPANSDDRSTIHVTMPTVASMQDPSSPTPRDNTVSADPRMQPISPAHSATQPKTPLPTPATAQTYSSMNFSPYGGPRVPLNTPQGLYGSNTMLTLGGTPDMLPLGTIHEQKDNESQKSTTRKPQPPETQLPKSRRSVRFAEESQDPLESEQFPDSVSVNLGETPVIESSEGPAFKGRGMKSQSDGMTSLTTNSRGSKNLTSPAMTPEPWPQIDEEEFKRSPPLSAEKPPSSVQSSLHNPADQSMAANVDSKSVRNMKSRESTIMSDKAMKMMQDGHVDSPGPPPPSPEPKTDFLSMPTEVKPEGALADIEDTQSDITITARPPSDLDDISRINTPKRMSRETTRGSELLPQVTEEENKTENIETKPTEETETKEINSENSNSELKSIQEDGAEKAPEQTEKVVEENDKSAEESEDTKVNVEINEGENNEKGNVTGEEGETEKSQAEKIATELDQFDSTEDTFKEQLHEELEKLSKT